MNGRRRFIQLAAVALIVPVELFRGRSQVAVDEFLGYDRTKLRA